MKKLFFIVSLILTIAVTIGEIQAQNVNIPASAQKSKRNRKPHEKPERPIVKIKTIPVKNIKTAGNWIEYAVPFDDTRGWSAHFPIEICMAWQLAYLAKQVNAGNNYAGKHFKLTADIDLGGLEWTPVGKAGEPVNIFDEAGDNNRSYQFCGLFHGNGHKITRLTITKGDDYSGLFGICGTGSHIENVHVVDAYVRGRRQVGGLVGELVDGSVSGCSVSGNIVALGECAGGIAGVNNGTITNSQSSAEIFCGSNSTGGIAGVNGDRMMGVIDQCKVTGLVTGFWNVGGLVGRNHGVISNSLAYGDVTGDEWVGGLVGWMDKGMISHCEASGNVKGFYDVGGLVGFNGYQHSTAQISNSSASGKVTGVGTGNLCIGGLAGYSGGIISDCHATGTVEGEESTGGLIGEHGGKTVNCYASGDVTGCYDTGGLVGFNGYPASNTLLENCYSSGKVTGYKTRNYGTGGLAGYSGGTIVRCFSTGSTSGDETVGGLVGEQEGTITNCYASGAVTAKQTAGGLVGLNWAKIYNSYAIGSVNSIGIAGGLIGQNKDTDAIVSDSYFDWKSTKQIRGIGLNNNEQNCLVKALSTKEFKNGVFLDGFDTTVWEIAQGQYPRLKTISARIVKL